MKEFLSFGGFGDAWGILRGYVGVLLEGCWELSILEEIKYHRNPKWWFQTYFYCIFYVHPYLGKIPKVSLTFFRWVETTNYN